MSSHIRHIFVLTLFCNLLIWRKDGEIVIAAKVFSRTHTKAKDRSFPNDRSKLIWVCASASIFVFLNICGSDCACMSSFRFVIYFAYISGVVL